MLYNITLRAIGEPDEDFSPTYIKVEGALLTKISRVQGTAETAQPRILKIALMWVLHTT